MEAFRIRIAAFVDSIVSSDLVAVPDPTPTRMAAKVSPGGLARYVCPVCSATEECNDAAGRERSNPVCPTCSPPLKNHVVELASQDHETLAHAANYVVPETDGDTITVVTTGENFDATSLPPVGTALTVASKRPPRVYSGKFLKVDDGGFVHVRREVPLDQLVAGTDVYQTPVRTTASVQVGSKVEPTKLNVVRPVLPPPPKDEDRFTSAWGPDVIKGAVDAYRRRLGSERVRGDGRRLDRAWVDKEPLTVGELVVVTVRPEGEVWVAAFEEASADGKSVTLRMHAHDMGTTAGEYDYNIPLRERTGIEKEWLRPDGGWYTAARKQAKQDEPKRRVVPVNDLNVLARGFDLVTRSPGGLDSGGSNGSRKKGKKGKRERADLQQALPIEVCDMVDKHVTGWNDDDGPVPFIGDDFWFSDFLPVFGGLQVSRVESVMSVGPVRVSTPAFAFTLAIPTLPLG